ncbi:UNVERIFIED_CONTAM: hypothetical protein Sradi_7042300 [Sesamum radiatum]|uniref:Transposase-associated domain-containing protein n=1 Tax=Sesamum radiatum TaxID=300843 RepID=A0AAW2J8Q7_SESRA
MLRQLRRWLYEKNLPNRAGLNPKFEDGVTTFIEWAKSRHAYMKGEKIRCPCRKGKNEIFKTPDEVKFDLYMKDFMLKYYNQTSHGEERVQEYFEGVTAPHLQDEQTPPAPVEEGTSTHWSDATEMNWAQRVFDAVGQACNHDGAANDGTRSCPHDAGPSSYCYGGGSYDYMFGLADQFHDVLKAAEQPLWNGCTTS